MAAEFSYCVVISMLTLGDIFDEYAVRRGIRVQTQHLIWDRENHRNNVRIRGSQDRTLYLMICTQ